ncbi:FtsK/SpoIIIE domain-containing protein [Agromyces sp. MMS24-K17]|uniref:FtsK/SpoIIIE domain-containing protein n=1 Tax=Agromyces sp. MMS24-K17 TaxID=3372850 RepID=UPI003754491F
MDHPLPPGLADRPLVLPAPLPDPARPGFPLLASLAPIGGAVVLWSVTGSAASLLFAALGPVVAVASMLDARRQRARLRRLARAERGAALAELEAAIADAHDAERRAAWLRSPSARSVLATPPGAAWHGPGPIPVVLGRAAAPSSLRVDGVAADELARAALARAAVLADAPCVADPAAGIGFVGPAVLARAAARAAVVHGAHRATPGDVAIEAPAADWRWVDDLPHRRGRRRFLLLDGSGRADAPASDVAGRIAVAPDEARLPPGLATVLRLEAPDRAVLARAAGVPDGRVVVPELVSDAEAAEWAVAARQAAERSGLLEAASALPSMVRWAEVAEHPAAWDRRSLAVVIGLDADGPTRLDLVADGPHAMVAGTTGSGKSEFLLAWLAALAAAYPPELVGFLLVDFKGGAAFEPLSGLPHVAGIVTDLDEAGAERAVLSLRAELRHREAVLRDAGARDIGELDAAVVLPRLVVVVDEFQAMIDRFADLGRLVADLAARGRSLGVHLVLAAQRPNGVLREGVTANCPIRVSLRVLQAADSTAVVGGPLAAELPAGLPGRAVLVRGDDAPVVFQSAYADAAALSALRAGRTGAPVRRPWLDPLPARLDRADLRDPTVLGGAAAMPGPKAGSRPTPDSGPGPGPSGPLAGGPISFGLLDDPEHQCRRVAGWAPEDGNLLVVGTAGSGRSTALASVATGFAERHGAASVIRHDGPRSAEWIGLHDLLASVRRGDAAGPRLLVLDDLDLRFRGWPEAYRLEGLDVVEGLLREGRAVGVSVAASARAAPSLGRLAHDGFGPILRLRHASRPDLVQSGGAGELWRPTEPAGSGQWQGLRVQVASAEAPSPESAPPTPVLSTRDLGDGRAAVAVVTPSPRVDADVIRGLLGCEPILLAPGAESAQLALAALAALAARAAPAAGGGAAAVIVGDAEAWAGAWALAAAVRDQAVVVARGGPAEYRALARDRGLPPLPDAVGVPCWVTLPGAEPVLRRWP